MSVIYTKSALKKIKKDDLIDIYLSQQQKMSQLRVNTEKLKDEVGELAAENDRLHTMATDFGKEIKQLKEQMKELLLERQRDTIDEARSARDKALSQVKELKEEIKQIKEENEKLAETADDTPDQCEICDKRFDLHYTMNHCDGNLREKYDDYFGSEDDQGDLCPDCILHHK